MLIFWIEQATGSCGYDAPHVFESDNVPPDNDARCLCGAVTWHEAVLAAQTRRTLTAAGDAASQRAEN